MYIYNYLYLFYSIYFSFIYLYVYYELWILNYWIIIYYELKFLIKIINRNYLKLLIIIKYLLFIILYSS